MKTPTIIRSQPLPKLVAVRVTRRRTRSGIIAFPVSRKTTHVRRNP